MNEINHFFNEAHKKKTPMVSRGMAKCNGALKNIAIKDTKASQTNNKKLIMFLI
ncbi:hypothetical protein ACH19I_03465 [Yersinia kristensenii]|uniref:hypothetical protein n=1 Tax=Yersinia kristensenii TaxID=28152 RepID=UPI003896C2EA